MIVWKDPAPGISRIYEPEPGDSLTVHVEAAPWFLGFCRWSVERRTAMNRTARLDERVRSGRWRWRGRGALLHESLVDATVSRIIYGHLSCRCGAGGGPKAIGRHEESCPMRGVND